VKQLELASQERIAAVQAQVDLLKAEIAAQSKLDVSGLGAQAGIERALYPAVMQNVRQLDQQAHETQLQAEQLQAQREAQQQQLAAQQQQQQMQQQMQQQQAGPPQEPGPEGAS
jgi:hypothetical protein